MILAAQAKPWTNVKWQSWACVTQHPRNFRGTNVVPDYLETPSKNKHKYPYTEKHYQFIHWSFHILINIAQQRRKPYPVNEHRNTGTIFKFQGNCIKLSDAWYQITLQEIFKEIKNERLLKITMSVWIGMELIL